MPRIASRRRLSASLIVLIVGLVAIVTGPSGARAYCNPNHQSWDPCYDGKNLKPPQEDAGSPLANAACGDLLLHVGASLGNATCRAANVSDADARARAETVSADGSGRFFFAEYVQAGIHTYIVRQQPSDILDETDLKPKADDWGPQLELQGFDVRRFNASVGTGIAHCASFTKHWGHVPQSTGYRHRIIGIYCSAREADIADDSLDRLLGSIEPSG
jgi:hypothetical protein